MRTIGTVGGSKTLQSFAAPNAQHKCPICGKKFCCGEQWRYAHKDSRGRRVYYCSYTCFRVWDRKQREKARQKIALDNDQCTKYAIYAHEYYERQKKERQEKLRAGQDVQAMRETRIRQCEGRIAYYETLVDAYPKGCRERERAMDNAASWRRKLAQCQREEKAHGTHDGRPESAGARKPGAGVSRSRTIQDSAGRV